jgi:hypothetical protein
MVLLECAKELNPCFTEKQAVWKVTTTFEEENLNFFKIKKLTAKKWRSRHTPKLNSYEN